MSQNGIKNSHKYTSSSSTIIAGPGVMYNEVTKMKPVNTRINENTNTYAVTIPIRYKLKRSQAQREPK